MIYNKPIHRTASVAALPTRPVIGVVRRIKVMVTRFSIIALTLTLPFAAVAQNDLTPSSVMAEIQESGASATVFQLYEDNSLWSALLKNIENGKPAWLKVASVL
jgi:hypothetical protein